MQEQPPPDYHTNSGPMAPQDPHGGRNGTTNMNRSVPPTEYYGPPPQGNPQWQGQNMYHMEIGKNIQETCNRLLFIANDPSTVLEFDNSTYLAMLRCSHYIMYQIENIVEPPHPYSHAPPTPNTPSMLPRNALHTYTYNQPSPIPNTGTFVEGGQSQDPSLTFTVRQQPTSTERTQAGAMMSSFNSAPKNYEVKWSPNGGELPTPAPSPPVISAPKTRKKTRKTRAKKGR